MKKILGLDLGTNSIGWALVEHDFETKNGNILGIGSRIIPMSQDVMDKFGQGQSHSQTADRTSFRGVRRLRQRHLLRRERLHRVLNILGALPEHYSAMIDFEDRKGQFKDNVEVKLNYREVSPQIYDFIFKDSFNEMVEEFRRAQPELFKPGKNGKETKIPYDWTIYYLRKKALEERIALQELAWLLINFNQKRGYYQLRGEEEETEKANEKTFEVLQVSELKDSGDRIKDSNEVLYDVYFTNGWKYDKQIVKKDNWINKTKEFIVTTSTNKDGTVKRTFKTVDSEKDWIAIKKKTEQNIQHANKSVGEFIYSTLLEHPEQKINGKLIRTVERHFYRSELIAILNKQKEFHAELQDRDLLNRCIIELYPNNFAQQYILRQKDFTNLFVNDIIFYQRPLKSKKSLIDGCKFETRTYKKDGESITENVKVIHKSHPLYQEFRLWQFVDNIRIYQREKFIDGKLLSDVDVTAEFIKDENARAELFDFFSDKSKIKQKVFLSNFKDQFGKKLTEDRYRWNYVEDKEYPLNETRAQFRSCLKKVEGFNLDQGYDIKDFEINLWHIIYSVKDKNQYEKALRTFASKNNIDKDSFAEAFKNFRPFNNNYGALSEKAIKKLLPLMRLGKYWSYDDIDSGTKSRIQKILTGEYDEKIRTRVREKAINLQSEDDFRGLPLWLASYIVYDRHSENSDNEKWEMPQQIDEFLKEFRQHSLRNPIVEQVITETLRVVRDIWYRFGNGEKNFFNEIHVELGRAMKNSADERKKLTAVVANNQNTNERIRALLREFKEENIEGVLPHSPNQLEKLKIFEGDILNQYSEKELEKEVYDGVSIAQVARSAEPTFREIQKYRLWMEQKYRSPYTGDIIPLSKLFTTEYEIEHVIPQARYFDDSYANKVICETEVNKTKGNQTAYEFISNNPGRKVDLGQGKSVSLFNIKEYQDFVSQHFKKGGKKFSFLLSEDIPEKFISRQMNDTRYISKVVKSLLNYIVRTEDEQEATSKNIVPVTGGVTTVLKKDWGLNDKWNEIIRPRFERMNIITGTNDFGYYDAKAGFYRSDVPKELKKDFSKKRIDHRHHAMDALIVALATRDHVGYLNNEHAKSDNKRYDLRNKLRRVEKIVINGKEMPVSREFYLPWQTFPADAKEALENIVVSFKQNLRVINKVSNRYQIKTDDKIEIKTQQGKNWAIRKPMHKDTVFARVELRKVKTVTINAALEGFCEGVFVFVDKQLSKKVKLLQKENYDLKLLKKYFKNNDFNGEKIKKADVYYFDNEFSATRKPIDESFKSAKWIRESVTDTGIQQILINHLDKYNETDLNGNVKERPDLAFSEDGLSEMNKSLKELNDGKDHCPIYKARVYETLGNKYPVGEKGNKKDKYVEAAKGTNLFFAVYEGENKKGELVRQYDTVPLNIVIERQKQGINSVPEVFYDKDNLEYKLLFSLSPNDLVYVPTDEELENSTNIDFGNLSVDQKNRIYKMVSCSGNRSYFIPNFVSRPITDKLEFSILNKVERSIDGLLIKEKCWKLIVDRLGNIEKIIR